MPTNLKLNYKTTTSYNKTEQITGTLTYDNEEVLKNTKINVYQNEVKKTVKTDKNGYFIYTFTTQKVGQNRITFQYIGTDRYIGSKESVTYNVDKIKTYTQILT